MIFRNNRKNHILTPGKWFLQNIENPRLKQKSLGSTKYIGFNSALTSFYKNGFQKYIFRLNLF